MKLAHSTIPLALLAATFVVAGMFAFGRNTALANFVMNAWQGYKLTDGLVAYWSFDGRDIDLTLPTAEVRDRAGIDNSGDWKNHATTTTIGKVGQAISFDGVDDVVSVPSEIVGVRTVAFWMKGTSTPSSKIMALNATHNIESINGTITANNFSSPTIYVDGVVSSVVTAGWHHVAITTAVGLSSSGVLLGAVGSVFFSGALDEVRMYDRTISADEIKRLYLMGASLKTNVSHRDQLTDSLVGNWTFDGKDIDLSSSTREVLDSVATGNSGDWRNHATSTVMGKIGQAITFDGVDDAVSMGAPSNLNITGPITISAWIYPRSFGGSSRGRIVDKDPAATTGFWFSVDNSNVTSGVGFGVNTGSAGTQFLGVANVSTLNRWQHVTVTLDPSMIVTIYVNGASVGSATFNAFPISNTNIFAIGGRISDNARNFDGAIDDVRVYNRALSAEEIKRLYLMGASMKQNVSHRDGLTDGLVGNWTFDGKDMTPNVRDSSTQGNHGGLQNQNPTTTTIGKIGQGTRFDGVDDHISMGAPSNLNITGPITISAWVYPRSFGGNSRGRIVDKDGAATAGYLFLVDNFNVSNGFSFMVNTTVIPDSRFSAPNAITLNAWQHVVASFNGTTVTLYKDGVASNGAQTMNAPASGVDNFVIGGRTTDNARNFDGTIDEVRVYNRALSADEVQRLYLMGK